METPNPDENEEELDEEEIQLTPAEKQNLLEIQASLEAMRKEPPITLEQARAQVPPYLRPRRGDSAGK